MVIDGDEGDRTSASSGDSSVKRGVARDENAWHSWDDT